uniref:PPM-type phosphatase domain-containing protein n=1 Tax=Amphimedon queenslandica TaxID=400682 RepID=A0A1X7UW22_AMPQE
MFPLVLHAWTKKHQGYLSTAGTTATVLVIDSTRIYVGNAGDSTQVIDVNNDKFRWPGEPTVKPVIISKDHETSDPEEIQNVERLVY